MANYRNILWFIALLPGIVFGAAGDKELNIDGAKWIWNSNSQTTSLGGSSTASESVDYRFPAAKGSVGQAWIIDSITDSVVQIIWGTPSTAAAHAILGSTHNDSTTQAVTRGSLIYGNSTPKWDEFGIGTGFLYGDGTDVVDYRSIDISDNTNLAVDTDHLKLTDDTLSLSDNEKLVAHSRQGSFLEQIDFTVSEAGGTVTGSLEKEGGGDLTQFWSDDYDVLDCTGPVCTVDLTPRVGTDTSPAAAFVYILQSDKTTLVASTSFPADSVEHIRICTLVLQSAATTGTDGALGVRNWNDPAFGITNPRGGDIVSSERVRKEHALHDSGVVLSITGSGTGTVTLDTTAGAVYQFNLQAFPLLDMTQYTIDAVSTGSKTFTISDDGDLSSTFPDARIIQVNSSTGNDGQYTVASTSFSSPDFVITVSEVISSAVADGTIGDNIHLVNLSGSEYSDSVNLVADITTLADSVTSLNNNKYFNVVIWAVQNRTGEISHLMCNLPTGQYTKEADAIVDASKFSVHTIPSVFRGTGFLIAELTFQFASGPTWTLKQNKDLLGQTPTLVPGGGTTTSISTFSDSAFELFDNGDDAKRGDFELSGITTGNTRTLTWPDTSSTILTSDGTTALAGAWDMGNQNLTNVDIDSGAIDGTTVGASSASTGAFSTLSASGAVTFGVGTQDYEVNTRSNSLTLQGQSSATDSLFEIYSKDGDATDRVGIQIFGQGIPTDISPSHFMRIRWDNVSGDYQIITGTSGGTNPDLFLSGGAARLFLEAGADGVQSDTIDNDPTSDAANLNILSSTNQLRRSTSSVRFKTIDSNMTADKAGSILNLTPVKFYSKCESDDPQKVYYGLTAEDVAANFPEAARYDPNGLPDSYDINFIVAALIKNQQELDAKSKAQGILIVELTKRLEILEIP